ncbi:DUF1684 domain-containing protein [Mesonia ostreae]|uniref:DUF1684 domain-containing protein n=1 Tax=Mesonia ostreae TaxID=861110 RepID=A0ABU2KEK8_9FLAO|nr:DUF1684 domain-containing protein [Mesonia ostreae]MDT0293140.1 DUF1684 domain-containing protein [Mesonia ostreae]
MRYPLFIISFFLIVSFQSVFSQSVQEAKAFHEKLNKEFKDRETSPLKEKDRKNFKQLAVFEVDSNYIISAAFKRTPYEKPFFMPTTTERKSMYVKYGEVSFTLEGKKIVLEVYQNQRLKTQKKYEDYLFIPFNDLTNGVSTYGGGRYLDLKIPKGNRMMLDFNQAYNPYCAYNETYSCPIPPEQNFIELEMEAGVKSFRKNSK